MTGIREAAEVLMRYGDYTETEDSASWLLVDAEAVAAAVPAGREAIFDALLETAFTWDPPEAIDRMRRDAIADALLEAS